MVKFLDGRPDISGSIVIVVPHQIASHANLVCLAAGGFEAVVRQPNERSQILNANVLAIKRSLRSRRDFTNDRSGISDLWRMISWFGEPFQMLVEKLIAPTVCCFGHALVRQHQPTGE